MMEADAQFSEFGSLLQRGPVALDCLVNRIEQILIAEWLGQKLDCAGFHRADAHWDVAVPGDENNRDISVFTGKLALELQSALARHTNVENQARGRGW